jgi:hypothetical protein
VDNILSWARRYRRWTPVVRGDLERVRFDTQQLQNPEISGMAYQQGELAGYELREYLNALLTAGITSAKAGVAAPTA